MQEAIEREGKYRRIQGSNVDITKQAIGCGFVKMGGPISGTIPADKKIVYLLNWIHDEIVSEAPEQNIVDAVRWLRVREGRAGGRLVKSIEMIMDGHIKPHWHK